MRWLGKFLLRLLSPNLPKLCVVMIVVNFLFFSYGFLQKETEIPTSNFVNDVSSHASLPLETQYSE